MKFAILLCATVLTCHATIVELSPPADQTPAIKTQLTNTPANYQDQFLAFALQKAEKYSGKVEDAIGAAVDAAQKEAPELARQFLVWRFVKSALDIGVPAGMFLAFFVVGTVSFYRWMDFYKDPARHDRRGYWTVQAYAKAWKVVPFSIIGILGTFGCFINTMVNIPALYTMAEIKYAPHVYLVEQVAALLHK